MMDEFNEMMESLTQGLSEWDDLGGPDADALCPQEITLSVAVLRKIYSAGQCVEWALHNLQNEADTARRVASIYETQKNSLMEENTILQDALGRILTALERGESTEKIAMIVVNALESDGSPEIVNEQP